MNLEESNSFVEQMEKNNKNKKTVLSIIIICALLIVVLIGAIGYIQYKDSLELKLYIDDKQIPISSKLLLQENGKNYMNVKELANFVGYSYQKGEYKNYTENSNSCYLKNDYEIVSMTADKESVKKYILNEVNNIDEDDSQENKAGNETIKIVVESKNETAETLSIKEPIKYINNELYVEFSEIPRIFNVSLNTSQKNKIKIYSLNALIELAPKMASNLGYTEVSNIYENLTAIVDNMLVVKNGKNYGVVSLENGQEIISMKYEKIVYMQNTEEFLVTAEDSVGIVDRFGNTIIKPTEYDSISILDESKKLYLVEKDKKYGVLNGDGETIVYVEYDSIGINNPEDFPNEEIKNYYLLFDECIPVNGNGKVGLFDTEGNENLKCVYDSLGYLPSSVDNTDDSDDDKNESKNNSDEEDEEENETSKNNTVIEEYDSVLTIPESEGIKGIVICRNGLYGIYDVKSKRLIPCSFTKIYSKTKAGVTTYYLEQGDEDSIKLETYLEENGFFNENNNSNKVLDNEDEQIDQENETIENN